jgi:hypothetical protein
MHTGGAALRAMDGREFRQTNSVGEYRCLSSRIHAHETPACRPAHRQSFRVIVILSVLQ